MSDKANCRKGNDSKKGGRLYLLSGVFILPSLQLFFLHCYEGFRTHPPIDALFFLFISPFTTSLFLPTIVMSLEFPRNAAIM